MIKKFTTFVRTHNIFWTGPFDCLKSFNNATQDNCDCKIIADRPVPLYIPRRAEPVAAYVGKISHKTASRGNICIISA